MKTNKQVKNDQEGNAGKDTYGFVEQRKTGEGGQKNHQPAQNWTAIQIQNRFDSINEKEGDTSSSKQKKNAMENVENPPKTGQMRYIMMVSNIRPLRVWRKQQKIQ